jgi:hypothetical protein
MLNQEVFDPLCDVELMAKLTPENRRKLLEKARALILTQDKKNKQKKHHSLRDQTL